MKRSSRSLALLSTAVLALGLGISSRANAAPVKAGEPQILAKDLDGPISTAVAEVGTAYVTANFGGRCYRIAADIRQSVAYKTKGYEFGGLSVSGDGLVWRLTCAKQLVQQIVAGGTARTLSNVMTHENKRHSDKATPDGFNGCCKS